MQYALIILAAIGLVELWFRAAPLQPIRKWLIVRFNRWYARIRGMDEPEWVCQLLAAPFWWATGVSGCDECLVPWVAFGLGFLSGLKPYEAFLCGAAAYGLFVMVGKKRG